MGKVPSSVLVAQLRQVRTGLVSGGCADTGLVAAC